MSKLFRHVVLYASCFIETVWTGMISVVVGLMTGGVQITLALAKFSRFFIFHPKYYLNQYTKSFHTYSLYFGLSCFLY